MKLSFLLLPLLLSSISAFANGASIACQINSRASNQLLAEKIAKNSNKQYQDDHFQIADLKKFILNIADQKLIGGVLHAPNSIGDQDFDFIGEDVATSAGALEGDVQVKFNHAKMQVNVAVDGYDHFSYKVKIDPVSRKASLAGNFMYDCGEPQLMYAVYDCEILE